MSRAAARQIDLCTCYKNFWFVSSKGIPWWHSGKNSACQCKRLRRHGFNPWVRKTPLRRKWQPASLFLSGKSHGQRSLVGYSPWSHRVRHDWAHTHNCVYWNTFQRLIYVLQTDCIFFSPSYTINRLSFAICFIHSNVYMSILVSQFIPLSPLVSMHLFSMCVYLFLLCR